MSDDRTTELREKLDELGIEHTDASYKLHTPITVWTVDSATFCYVEGFESTDLHIDNATPEQAIAATLGEQVIRCRDCKHATISTTGVCKYCEMFVLPDVDGYGADPQVNLPLDFFCGFAERKEVG